LFLEGINDSEHFPQNPQKHMATDAEPAFCGFSPEKTQNAGSYSPYALFAYIISDIAQKDLERFAGQGLK
jgi:hypothetical protein